VPGRKCSAVKPPASRDIAAALAGYDGLLEVGVGRRPAVARRLAAEHGRPVVAVDVDAAALDAIRDDLPDAVTLREADVLALADRAERGGTGLPGSVAAVYAVNLPAELQRPTARLAAALDADCRFTTLGFEEPVVPVERRRLGGEPLYSVAGDPNRDRR